MLPPTPTPPATCSAPLVVLVLFTFDSIKNVLLAVILATMLFEFEPPVINTISFSPGPYVPSIRLPPPVVVLPATTT